MTPLHVAARRNGCGVAAAVLAWGAAVHPRNVDGDTPLHRAASGNALEAAAVLLACGVDVVARAHDGAAPLHVAALKDAYATASLLLLRGADVGARSGEGASPLHVAACGTRWRQRRCSWRPARMSGRGTSRVRRRCTGAAMADAVAVATALLDREAAIEARDENDRTPLHWASYNAARDAAAVLVERGADVQATVDGGATPFASAPHAVH